MGISIAVTVLMVIGGMVIASIASRSSGGLHMGWYALAGLLIITLVLTWVFVTWKTQQLTATVLRHDGAVCPKCMKAVVRDDGTESVRCPKCERAYSVEQLRAFWTLFVNDPAEASQMLLRDAGSEDRGSFASFITRGRGRLGLAIGCNAVIWFGMGMFVGVMDGGSIIASALTYLHMFLVMTGAILFAAGWKHRQGSARRCASCGYQRAPDDGDATLPRCPECAAEWNAIGGTIEGQFVRRPHLICIGAVIALAGLALVFLPLFQNGNWLDKALPTGSLIAEVTQASGFTRSKWIELRTRTLTAEQTLQLARGLLDKRLRKRYFSADADNWLISQIAAGTLPDDLVQRYYAEAMEVWIVAPATVKVGETMELAIGTRYRHAATNNPKPVALISGFFVGDDPEPRGRQTAGIPGISLGKVRLQVGDRDRGPGQGPIVSITPDAPGDLRVRLELWIATMPMPWTVDSIVWNADGTPQQPAGAVWMERRSVEHVIEVVP